MRKQGRGNARSQGGDTATGGRSQRQLRVGEEIRHILSDVLRRAHFRDPDLAGAVITVTEVRVSPDLKNATAFVMPLTGATGAGDDTDTVLKALDRAHAYIRTLVAEQLNLRFAPTLSFKRDASFDAASRIEQVLQRPEVQADLHKDAPVKDDPADKS